MKYCIRWTSKLTGESGQGTELFSKSEAEELIKEWTDKNNSVYYEVMEVVEVGEE